VCQMIYEEIEIMKNREDETKKEEMKIVEPA
jgi:hypothetical protein